GRSVAHPLSAILAMSAAMALAQSPKGQEKKASTPAKLPPWERVLKDDDAKRVAHLEKQIAELEKTGQFAEAVAPAREAVAIRDRVQGDDHWETVDARIEAQTCARLARLSRGDQMDLARALTQTDRADDLRKEGRHAEAQELLQAATSVHRRLLGEEHP